MWGARDAAANKAVGVSSARRQLHSQAILEEAGWWKPLTGSDGMGREEQGCCQGQRPLEQGMWELILEG